MNRKKKSFAFGVETSFSEAQVILLPIPWEVTASYGAGTSDSLDDIREASFQLDFFNKAFLRSVNHLIYLEEPPPCLQAKNHDIRPLSLKWMDQSGEGSEKLNKDHLAQINQACREMVDWVYKKTQACFDMGKIPAVIGGDHSVSEGIVKAVSEKYQGDFGILHIDAHFDLREKYQGFDHSHASIMFNILNQKPSPKALVSVGVRDFCEEEYELAQSKKEVHPYFDRDMSDRLFKGEPWSEICKEIVSHLPQFVYISLDVDGLEWSCAPGTGTPVPGGLSFNQVLFLFKELKNQKKTVCSFDVVETSTGDTKVKSLKNWNANVSARLIYEMCFLLLQNQEK